MSRWDTTGLFWDDYVAPRLPTVKEKRTPPVPVWLNDDYLPGLDEAMAYTFNLMSDAEIVAEAAAKNRLVWDTEEYPNYSLIGFKSLVTGKHIVMEAHDGAPFAQLERDKLLWILRNFCSVGFNDDKFDLPIASAAIAGYGTVQLSEAAQDLITGGLLMQGMRPQDFNKKYGVSPLIVDHIDLIDLTPLAPGLKVCAGRMHSKQMRDLPFPPGKRLTTPQKTILRHYWSNDLDNTETLYRKNLTAIELRELLTKDYGVDVRSKSDPQIAEQVLRVEVKRITGRSRIDRAAIRAGEFFYFTPPAYAVYTSPTMKWVLEFIKTQKFYIDPMGSPQMPIELEGLDIEIAGNIYRMGIGGLHSQEKRTIHHSDEEYELSDNDVTSYYPMLIIKQGMYPPNVGPAFLQSYSGIVYRRIAAKEAGDKGTAETLKIVANGTFGKTGERGGWSIVYYPEMMIQVTLSGQMSLLMLIERLELEGIHVVSANTDGIMIKCPRQLLDRKAEIIKQWEVETGLNLETKGYKSVYSRDVNNYIAVYEKPDKKETGAWQYAKAIGTYRKTTDVYPLKWNPTCDVCGEAVIMYLAQNVPLAETIQACTDIRKFIEVRRVSGGAVKNGEYLGKVIRWYYGKNITDPIINAKNGNNVPKSKGAQPCMTLPDSIPEDLDYDYYVDRAQKMIDDFYPKVKVQKASDKIANYVPTENQIALVEEHGWEQLWSSTFWVRKEWRANPKIDIDKAGVPFEVVWSQVTGGKPLPVDEVDEEDIEDAETVEEMAD